MISESLKINTTLTELYLLGDDKIMKIQVEIRKKSDSEIDNEEGIILEMKELR